jgi:hypothetical protein
VKKKKDTKIINLWAGAGVGKTTQAAALFVLKKRMEKEKGYSVELVREYVKPFAWMGVKITPEMQNHVYFMQLQLEMTLVGLVDYIITDSPTAIGLFYSTHYHQDWSLLSWERHKREQVTCIDYWCQRTKPYNQEGRYEDEKQAVENDAAMNYFLTTPGVGWNVTVLPKVTEFAPEVLADLQNRGLA